MLVDNTTNIAKLFNTTVKNINFCGVDIDSRNDLTNKLFIALKGENFDAHNFIKNAEDNGAVAIIAHKKITTKLPVIYVKDTTKALGIIASFHKNKINPVIIAITGSNGKTTTKNMLFNILSKVAPTLKTMGNFNNHIGVPLTLLNLEKKHKFAIIEMGANHIGEIKYLQNLVRPNIACVINALDAHIGEFGGFSNLFKTKCEIYHSSSINIINANLKKIKPSYLPKNGNLLFFGKNTNVSIDYLNNIKLKLIGEHNLENALAAITCCLPLNIDNKIIKQGLEDTIAEKGRLEIIKKQGITIINDSYNASPSSTKYALKVLSKFDGIKIAVLGNMAELGENSKNIHQEVGNIAKTLNINYLYSIGDTAKNYGVTHFTNKDSLIKQLQKNKNTTILFKGSRSARLENLINSL